MLSERIKYTYREISKYVATHSKFYVLMKLENIMRVQILNRNISLKDGLKIFSRTKTKNYCSMIDQGLHCA